MNKKLTSLGVAIILSLQSGCATGPLKETFNSDDPCNNNKRNLFAVLGGVAGAVIANKTAKDKNKTANTVLGGAAGATLFGLIGSELDKRECALHKIKLKNSLDMQVEPIKAHVATKAPQSGTVQQKSHQKVADVGLSVSVVNQSDKPQFLTGSDQLQPHARAHFLEIAKLYTIEYAQIQAEGLTPEARVELIKNARNKRILLVGHTDDTGNTDANARLSERRAKAIARIFQQAGVYKDQLFYQGAGETMPIADNMTVVGRAKNRRVEIVDLSDEKAFQLYLKSRRPNTAFYRPIISKKKAQAKTIWDETPKVVEKANKQQKKKVDVTTKKRVAKQTKQPVKSKRAGFIDFKGQPLTSDRATINVAEMVTTKRGFSVIGDAVASDVRRIKSCNLDRPRNAGLVKSLKSDLAYANTDFLPGLNGQSWYQMVGGNLVVLHDVNVFSANGLPANKPKLKVYANYKNTKNKRKAKPQINIRPEVNTYQTTGGLLYRVFANNQSGVQCMDMLMPAKYSRTAHDGKIIYQYSGDYVANFKPKMKK